MSLYLKYRPKDFSSLVGQDFIKETLKKAVLDKKTVGAYLFCGPRGTGKTSSARIFTKAINCLNPNSGDPCNNCEICNGINTESLVDVIEIDAASHTGVDNIREIIEKARFNPSHAKYKTYIIDEVHMLSKGAFNALLKILEEPPEYVKFILATTETHKVPETIISRCQRYDFKRINEADIKSRLNYIAKSENITIDDKSINYIAKSSAGGLRNAISLFEQLVNDNNINYENIIKTLGIVEYEILENFLNKLINQDSTIIEDFDKLISTGKNIKLFFKELIFHIKEIATKKAVNKEDIGSYIKILDILDETYSKTKNSLDENTTFLIGLLKLITNYKTKTQVNPNKEDLKTIINTTKSSQKEEKTIENKEEDLSHNDIEDIFGNISLSNPPKKDNKNISEIKDINLNSGAFDKDNFIGELKKLGAKGGLTMSIRGANTILNGETLTIKFKTSFALKSVNTADNLGLINGSLNSMGMENIKVELK